jgi:hypothetical protein
LQVSEPLVNDDPSSDALAAQALRTARLGRRAAETGHGRAYRTMSAKRMVEIGRSAAIELLGHAAGLSVPEALRAATASAGEHLGLAPLGRLTAGAPADLLVTEGDALADLKRLEYPALVLAGGRLLDNRGVTGTVDAAGTTLTVIW